MLPRAARLRSGRDFRAAYSRSQSFATPRLVLHVRNRRRSAGAEGQAIAAGEAPAAPLRVGFSISRKTCRKAHDRNRLKRRLREITRREILPALRGERIADVVVVARSPAPEAEFDILREDLCKLFRQARLTAEL